VGWIAGERKRRKVLDETKRKLESAQPPESKIKKKTLATCDWERGELIAYRMTSGDFVVLRMLDKHVDLGGAYPQCELLDWRGPELPSGGLPDTTPVRDLMNYSGGKRIMILSTGKREVKDRVIRLNVKHSLDENYSRVKRGYPNPARVTSWRDFDKLLAESYGIR
jgi:hypothetical protein